MRTLAFPSCVLLLIATSMPFAGRAQAQAAYIPTEMEDQADTLRDAPASDGAAAGKSADLVIAPLPVSNPALGTGAALAGVLYYNPNDAPQPWVTGVAAGYTSTDSWGGGLFHQMSLDDDRFRISGLAGYGDAKLKFYGIGPQAGAAGISVNLRDRGLKAYIDGQVRLFDHGLLSRLHLGVRVSYLRIRSSISIPTPDHPELELPGVELRSNVNAIGPSFTFDSRDHPFNPRKGVLVTGTWMFGAGFLGSDFQHRKLEILSTAYFPVARQTVLAVRRALCAVKGKAPFYDLCLFGQHADLRGYEAGRYRDRASWVLQGEVRQKISRRFGVVGFAGVGGIAPSAGDIWKHSHVLASGGAGLRYLASESNNVNLRFDVAWGKDGSAIYFGIGEAF
ncbi:BamA/TamA family outer membrane protein [Novosphingobium album (ex Hu et al. 2023)]|uniref:BamA/TamA family outer membrane protein n=1 Tax=Novosphingobium album (ex Hu et al. 2023) TaxID=2930093 RepID=A0ABT0B0G5_9SPHN|nr:BamA/TamA family outer membrane protein [Novosphingobium album (ex Hu et al. 2023)]MCJ2178383.1 BamA/TamA family outer membrane protein [Novosphingobium album (ex Hu et al. 2023)]